MIKRTKYQNNRNYAEKALENEISGIISKKRSPKKYLSTSKDILDIKNKISSAYSNYRDETSSNRDYNHNRNYNDKNYLPFHQEDIRPTRVSNEEYFKQYLEEDEFFQDVLEKIEDWIENNVEAMVEKSVQKVMKEQPISIDLDNKYLGSNKYPYHSSSRSDYNDNNYEDDLLRYEERVNRNRTVPDDYLDNNNYGQYYDNYDDNYYSSEENNLDYPEEDTYRRRNRR